MGHGSDILASDIHMSSSVLQKTMNEFRDGLNQRLDAKLLDSDMTEHHLPVFNGADELV